MTDDQDLFGHRPLAPAPRHPGRKIHLSMQARALAEQMRREGASAATIGEKLGIHESTVWNRLELELERGMPGGRRAGRPRWAPSAEDRATVVRMTAEGATVEAIAARLGCSEPTLRLHCRGELAQGRRRRRTAAR